MFRAPAEQGEYTARFQLTANGHTLDGGTLELPVTVTADAPVGYTAPTFSSATTRTLIVEPNIRVGLYKVTEPVKFQSPYNYEVWAGEILKGTLPANELAEIKYYDGLYTFTAQSLSFTVRDKIRLMPTDYNGYFNLANYDRYVSWKGAKNFNAYRGTMEFKYSDNSGVPWVVNELPLDAYIAGIAETSNGAAMEYIKALLVAARSYAYFHMNNGTPADQRTFDVVATTADQLYLGYNSEVLMPRVVQAARATFGEMVTYGGTPVVTPYFGHSDGKTRTWKEVWGGTDKAWLIPVVCKYDVGETMWGHGVGMSAQDAAYRADKDAWTYDQLLKYYYTGVAVERIY
jgi:stage II sporulation protein D